MATPPPPKVVHGYKFNIFHPDLIEGAKAPSMVFSLPLGHHIAFRIVGRDREFSLLVTDAFLFRRNIGGLISAPVLLADELAHSSPEKGDQIKHNLFPLGGSSFAVVLFPSVTAFE